MPTPNTAMAAQCRSCMKHHTVLMYINPTGSSLELICLPCVEKLLQGWNDSRQELAQKLDASERKAKSNLVRATTAERRAEMFAARYSEARETVGRLERRLRVVPTWAQKAWDAIEGVPPPLPPDDDGPLYTDPDCGCS